MAVFKDEVTVGLRSKCFSVLFTHTAHFPGHCRATRRKLSLSCLTAVRSPKYYYLVIHDTHKLLPARLRGAVSFWPPFSSRESKKKKLCGTRFVTTFPWLAQTKFCLLPSQMDWDFFFCASPALPEHKHQYKLVGQNTLTTASTQARRIALQPCRSVAGTPRAISRAAGHVHGVADLSVINLPPCSL